MEGISKISGLLKTAQKNSKVCNVAKTKPYPCDTFEKSVSFKGKFDEYKLLEKEYDLLSPEEKDFLRESADVGITETASDCIGAAKNIIKNYNAKFGEGNWEYISIGRSCSPVADALNKLGVKTYTIPISGLQTGIESLEEFTGQEGFKDYKQYIYNLGLNPDVIKSSPKTYIFQDYADQGTTIKTFEKIIRSEDMGLNFKNVFFESINEAFKEGFGLCENTDEAKNIIRVHSKLAAQNTPLSIKNFTSIPKLDWHNLSDIKDLIITESSGSKLFKFILSDILANSSMYKI